MDSRISALAGHAEIDFNTVAFEKRLLQLKDSQESINALSAWCLEHRQHHKKIVTAWLNVLKKVKVEQRLTLFYLANDVIQYSKRKNYDFVGSWGTTLQKATTMVREEKVKHKILRIFKIWEQRGIYGEEFIADLSGLISASTIGQKIQQDPSEFQPSYLITKIRSCSKLEADTDSKLKHLTETSPKITDVDTLFASLKDRAHVEDVEREVEEGIALIEAYVNALRAEIKSRTHLISILGLADTFYHTERGEVKVVANAYKNFGTRVKNLKKKLDELIPTLGSPIPSPDVNAPSPEPDSDIELPNNDLQENVSFESSMYKFTAASGMTVYSMTDTYSAGYYNPAPTQEQPDFSNSFPGFMSSANMSFDNQSSNMYMDQRQNDTFGTQTSSHDMSHHHMSQHDPGNSDVKITYDYGHQSQPPLLPPPMPPFTTSGYMDSVSYSDGSYAPTTDSYANSSNYQPIDSGQYAVSSEVQTSYNPDAYNPEEDIETWEPESNWEGPPDLETPESPPMFEKEGFADPIEYDDSKSGMVIGAEDVDHRVLLPPPQIPPQLSDHRLMRSNSTKDVDHRNLISLTGSPAPDQPPSPGSILLPPPALPALWTGTDQDYRIRQDQDYRVPPSENIVTVPISNNLTNDTNRESLYEPVMSTQTLRPIESLHTPVMSTQTVRQVDPPIMSTPTLTPMDNLPESPGVNTNNVSQQSSDLRSPENNVPIMLVGNQPNNLRVINNNQHNMDIAHQLQLPPPPPPPPPMKSSPKLKKQQMNHDNVESIDMDLSDDDSCQKSNIENIDNVNMRNNRRELMEPPPIPPNLCDMSDSKMMNGPPLENSMMASPMPGSLMGSGPFPMMPPPMQDWFEGGPHPDMHNRPFPPMFHKRHPPNEFRGGFRGRGIVDPTEIFRGRGRGRGFRGIRGNNWVGNNRGFMPPRGPPRGGFRGLFRGGFM